MLRTKGISGTNKHTRTKRHSGAKCNKMGIRRLFSTIRTKFHRGIKCHSSGPAGRCVTCYIKYLMTRFSNQSRLTLTKHSHFAEQQTEHHVSGLLKWGWTLCYTWHVHMNHGYMKNPWSHLVDVRMSQEWIVTADISSGGRIVWVEISCEQLSQLHD